MITQVISGACGLIQLFAAIAALRLVPVSRWKGAWGVISLALLLTAARKFTDLAILINSPEVPGFFIYLQIVELVVSSLLLLGVLWIRPMFEESRRAGEVYELFVQKSIQGLAIYQNGRIVFANPAFAFLTGYKIAELIEMDAETGLKLFHPNDRHNVQSALEMRGLEIPSIRKEVRLLSKRETVYWVEAYFGQSSYRGQPAIQATIINVTDRKRVEDQLHSSEMRHRIISQLTSDYIYSVTVSPENKIQIEWINGAFERMTGYTVDQLVKSNRGWDLISHPDDLIKTVEAYTFALSNQPVVIEYRILTKSGEAIWLRDYLQPVWSEREKRVSRLLGAVQDITSRKRAEFALQESEARWRSLVENAPVFITTIDQDYRIVWANRGMGEWQMDDMIGKDFLDLIPKDQRHKVLVGLRTVFKYNRQDQFELEMLTPTGRTFWFETIVGPIRQNGEVSSAIFVSVDITARKEIENQLMHLSTHDTLTGLFNRAYFETELVRLQDSRLYPVSIVMVDVNGLKKTNDQLGHAAGDELLRNISLALKDSFRTEDVVARIGGDEFAMLLPQTDETTATSVVQRLESNLAVMNAKCPPYNLSVSIGVATADQERNLVKIMKLADDRMYEHKALFKSQAENSEISPQSI